MGDARAEHAPEGLVDPAVAWGTLGLHVVAAKGAHGALECGVVSVGSFIAPYFWWISSLKAFSPSRSVGSCAVRNLSAFLCEASPGSLAVSFTS